MILNKNVFCSCLGLYIHNGFVLYIFIDRKQFGSIIIFHSIESIQLNQRDNFSFWVTIKMAEHILFKTLSSNFILLPFIYLYIKYYKYPELTYYKDK